MISFTSNTSTDKFQLMKSGKDVEVTIIVMNGQFEWSSNTISIVQSFFSSLQRSRSYSGEMILQSSSSPSAKKTGKLPWKLPEDLNTTLNFEATNINMFITNNYKGELSCCTCCFTGASYQYMFQKNSKNEMKSVVMGGGFNYCKLPIF